MLSGLQVFQVSKRLGEIADEILELPTFLLLKLLLQLLDQVQHLATLLCCTRSADLLRLGERLQGQVVVLHVLCCHAPIEVKGRIPFPQLGVSCIALLIGNEGPLDFIGPLGIDEEVPHIGIAQRLPVQGILGRQCYSLLGLLQPLCIVLLSRRRLAGVIASTCRPQGHGEVAQGHWVGRFAHLQGLFKAALCLGDVLHVPVDLTQAIPGIQKLRVQLQGF
mmetsp:Transcript_28246/g.45432  ORF Transcript_28246/g.45432 Transcript_28246/m.45432 type:complete len:221 (-) Transcript_28246:393-1055(-)